MSRIGRMPIAIPAGVEVKIDGSVVTVKGAKATLTREFHPNMTIAVEGNEILVTRPNDDKHNRALHGLSRSLIQQNRQGCSKKIIPSLSSLILKAMIFLCTLIAWIFTAHIASNILLIMVMLVYAVKRIQKLPVPTSQRLRWLFHQCLSS